MTTSWDERSRRALGASRARRSVSSSSCWADPGIISFAGGIPDAGLFPQATIAAAFAAILGDASRASAALQYSVSEGYPPLRQWLVEHMAGLGVACAPKTS